MATGAEQVEGGIEGTDWEIFARDPMISRRVAALLNVGAQSSAKLVPPGDAVRHGHLEVLKYLSRNSPSYPLPWVQQRNRRR